MPRNPTCRRCRKAEATWGPYCDECATVITPPADVNGSNLLNLYPCECGSTLTPTRGEHLPCCDP